MNSSVKKVKKKAENYESVRNKNFFLEQDEVEDLKFQNETNDEFVDEFEKISNTFNFISEVIENIKEFANFEVLPLAENLKYEHVEILIKELNNT